MYYRSQNPDTVTNSNKTDSMHKSDYIDLDLCLYICKYLYLDDIDEIDRYVPAAVRTCHVLRGFGPHQLGER